LRLLLKTEEPVASSRDVSIHLGDGLFRVAGLDHREDARVLIGDHLWMQKMAHLYLRHAQVRLTDDQLM
jgi:hypothetical protein